MLTLLSCPTTIAVVVAVVDDYDCENAAAGDDDDGDSVAA